MPAAEQKALVAPTTAAPISGVNSFFTSSQWFWMNFQARSRFLSLLKRDGELNSGVLIADFVGDGVLERALRQIGIFEHCEQTERADLDFGIGGGLGDFLQLIEERCVAIARGDLQSGLREVGIDGVGVGEVFLR